jgi:hypothetical protein
MFCTISQSDCQQDRTDHTASQAALRASKFPAMPTCSGIHANICVPYDVRQVCLSPWEPGTIWVFNGTDNTQWILKYHVFAYWSDFCNMMCHEECKQLCSKDGALWVNAELVILRRSTERYEQLFSVWDGQQVWCLSVHGGWHGWLDLECFTQQPELQIF